MVMWVDCSGCARLDCVFGDLRMLSSSDHELEHIDPECVLGCSVYSSACLLMYYISYNSVCLSVHILRSMPNRALRHSYRT